MADTVIPQAEADALIAMDKHCAEEKQWLFPPPGARLSVPLVSADKRENFMLDITRATIRLTKVTYQNRARQAIVLLRLDLDGRPHSNPHEAPPGPRHALLAGYAGQVISCPHLHFYVEGYGDKWAIPAPVDKYPNVQDLFSTFEAFMDHCNITQLPRIEKGLFL